MTNVGKDLPYSGRALDAYDRAETVPNANTNNLEPVFIVGQYKCGTSWLLRILSAHPQVNGVAEIDVVRAAYELPGGKNKQAAGSAPHLASVEHRLHRFFDGSGGCAHYDGSR